jgi:hypothetical protein
MAAQYVCLGRVIENDLIGVRGIIILLTTACLNSIHIMVRACSGTGQSSTRIATLTRLRTRTKRKVAIAGATLSICSQVEHLLSARFQRIGLVAY